LYAARENLKDAKKNYEKTEDDLKSLQSVGQIIGEVLRSLDSERCKWENAFFHCFVTQLFCVNKMIFSVSVYNLHFHPCHRLFLVSYLVMSNQLKSVFLEVIVKASSGPRYVVGCRSKVDKEKLIAGTRVVLDMTTLTIMRTLPREVYGCYILFLYVLVDYLFNSVILSGGFIFKHKPGL
jgi:ATP-dependent 26S proteasome regulatory subunit